MLNNPALRRAVLRLGLLLALAPFLLLTAFNQPFFDDFRNAYWLREHGPWGVQAWLFQTWTGRFTSTYDPRTGHSKESAAEAGETDCAPGLEEESESSARLRCGGVRSGHSGMSLSGTAARPARSFGVSLGSVSSRRALEMSRSCRSR